MIIYFKWKEKWGERENNIDSEFLLLFGLRIAYAGWIVPFWPVSKMLFLQNCKIGSLNTKEIENELSIMTQPTNWCTWATKLWTAEKKAWMDLLDFGHVPGGILQTQGQQTWSIADIKASETREIISKSSNYCLLYFVLSQKPMLGLDK